jgi:hypothetical protein
MNNIPNPQNDPNVENYHYANNILPNAQGILHFRTGQLRRTIKNRRRYNDRPSIYNFKIKCVQELKSENI